ncbi:M15 family metallopeptidase [Amycolatopsis sp.]|uniref:M15 family metallopeptidase n=1 Tax=Amycolatopsis sp. TaxID=37632 RepID=UPI002DFC9FB3|nr:M15 family metallopeptidase [Amycolatopsis sp.]
MRILTKITMTLTAAVMLTGAVAGTASASTATADETALPPYVALIRSVSAAELGKSWHEGCPLGPDQLKMIKLRYFGFDGRAHNGEVVVSKDVAVEVAQTFGELYQQRFAIERMENVANYDADDDRSMEANNTSAFNCREITGGGGWSNHSYGRAIDINPQINPYISAGGTVYPPNGAPYVDRTPGQKGMIYAQDNTVKAFEQRGWDWGGYWDSPIDYQHFEKPLT